MNQNFFQIRPIIQNWTKPERILFQIFIAIFLISLLFFGYSWFRGNENILHWNIISELDEIPTILNTFSDGSLKFTVNGNAYIVKEQFLASAMQVNYWANYTFLFFYLISLCLIITSLTTLKRWFFLGGITIFTAILLSFRLEILQIFGFVNQTSFLVSFIIFAGTAYYFNEFGEGFSFWKRFLTFIFLTIIFALIVAFGSKIPQPALAISSYVILSAMVLSSIFIFMISHEIMAAFVFVVSNSSNRGKNSLPQLFIISTIYLLNVLLIYLKNTNAIEWDGLIISPLALLLVSLLVGFFGYKKYCDAGNFVDFRNAGVWLYLGLAIITTSTIAFAFATGNDSLQEVLADVISYTHLVMGVVFFVHILVNFIQPLQKGLEVHKIIYKPAFSPLLIARIFGISAIVALAAMKHYFPVYQTLAGFNNAIADYYLATDDTFAAQTYYKQAIQYDFQNHKSNYAMASLAMQNKDEINAEYFFKQALLKNPTEFAFAGRTKALLEEDRYFEALFNLNDGVKKFPKSAELLTNLAYLHARAKGGNDSLLFYLNLAKKYCSNCDVVETNLLAFYAKNGDKTQLDSIVKISNSTNYTSLKANFLAINNKIGKKNEALPEIKIAKDSALNVSEFALIYNASVRETQQIEQRISGNEIQKLKQKDANASFVEDLTFAQACSDFFGNNKIEGIKQLAILANDSTAKYQLYKRTVGMWFLQEGVFDKALQYLSKSGDKYSVELLQQKNYADVIKNAQKNQAEALLKNAKSKSDFDYSIQQAPLNPLIISRVVSFYNDNLKKPNEAYKIIFDALVLNDSSVDLWKNYTMQSLSMGLRNYAEDGLQKLKALSPPADYQAFLSTYQAKKALMEKNSEGFN